MKITVKHIYPCKSESSYQMRTFLGLFGYTKARHTFACPVHKYKCVAPIDIIKENWRNS